MDILLLYSNRRTGYTASLVDIHDKALSCFLKEISKLDRYFSEGGNSGVSGASAVGDRVMEAESSIPSR